MPSTSTPRFIAMCAIAASSSATSNVAAASAIGIPRRAPSSIAQMLAGADSIHASGAATCNAADADGIGRKASTIGSATTGSSIGKRRTCRERDAPASTNCRTSHRLQRLNSSTASQKPRMPIPAIASMPGSA